MKKLLFLAFLVGAYLLVRKLQEEQAQFAGMTRSQARARLSEKLAPKLDGRVEAEQQEQILDSILDAMTAKGVITADPE